MTRTYRFVKPIGIANCTLADGSTVRLPVFPGIVKHLPANELVPLLEDEYTARKYTRLALERAAWAILREFPRDWLIQCLEKMPMRQGRRQALMFLLGVMPSPFAAAELS